MKAKISDDLAEELGIDPSLVHVTLEQSQEEPLSAEHGRRLQAATDTSILKVVIEIYGMSGLDVEPASETVKTYAGSDLKKALPEAVTEIGEMKLEVKNTASKEKEINSFFVFEF